MAETPPTSPPLHAASIASNESFDGVFTRVTTSNFAESARHLIALYHNSGLVHPDFPTLHADVAEFLDLHLEEEDHDFILNHCKNISPLVDTYHNMIITQLDNLLSGTSDEDDMVFDVFYGLTSIIAHVRESIGYEKPKAGLAVVVTKLLRKAPDIWDTLWLRRNEFTALDYKFDFLTAMEEFICVFTELCVDLERIPKWNDSHILHLAFLCWFHQDPDNPNIDIYSTIRNLALLAPWSDRPKDPMQAFKAFGEECTEEYDAKAFITRFYRDLEREDLVDIELQDCITTLTTFLAPETVVLAGAQVELSRLLIAALRRQQSSGKEEYEWLMWTVTVSFLGSWMSKQSDLGIVPIARDHHFGTVLCHGMILCSQAQSQSRDSHIITNIVEEVCLFASACKRMKTRVQKESYKTLRRDVRTQWLPALREIREANRLRPGHSQLLEGWHHLGRILGLDGAREQARSFCASKACEFSTVRSSYHMKTCMGCKKVCYCDRGCQRSDWKDGHKRTCIRKRNRT